MDDFDLELLFSRADEVKTAASKACEAPGKGTTAPAHVNGGSAVLPRARKASSCEFPVSVSVPESLDVVTTRPPSPELKPKAVSARPSTLPERRGDGSRPQAGRADRGGATPCAWASRGDSQRVRPEKATGLPQLPPSTDTEASNAGVVPNDAAALIMAPPVLVTSAAAAAAVAAPTAISLLAAHLFYVDAAGALHCRTPPSAVVTAALPAPPKAVKTTGIDSLGDLVNTYAARCLRPYQLLGVAWMHWRLSQAGGCILGDDMGLGKTCQGAALLGAILGKTGIKASDDLEYRRAHDLGSESICSASVASKPRLPVLILAPKAVVKNWERELATWGWFTVRQLGDGQKRAARQVLLQDVQSGRVEVVLATYEMALLFAKEEVLSVRWGLLILDEAHKLKNAKTKLYQAASELRQVTQYCVGLTGTPMQNRMLELFHVFNLVIPGCLGDQGTFESHVAKPIDQGQEKPRAGMSVNEHRRIIAAGDRARTALRQGPLATHMLRRLKTVELSNQLPRKTDVCVYVPLTDLQSRMYRRFLSGIDVATCLSKVANGGPTGPLWRLNRPGEETFADGKFSPLVVMGPTLIILGRLCNHVELIKTPLPRYEPDAHRRACYRELAEDLLPEGPDRDAAGGVNTLEATAPMKRRELELSALVTILEDAHGKGEKTLVFSRSVRLLTVLEAFLRMQYSIRYNIRMYHGGMGDEAREQAVIDFNEGEANVFLVSLKAGGVGLNLTAASRVILFDPDWNPANDLQAQDRAYRIGQTREVTVYRLLTIGTIEEAMYVRQLKKIQIAKSVTEGGNAPRMIAADDVVGIASLLRYVPEGIVSTRFKEYQAAKTRGQLLLSEDDVAAVAAQDLAAKRKVMEEAQGYKDDGSDDGDDSDSADIASRGGLKRGLAASNAKSGAEDDNDNSAEVLARELLEVEGVAGGKLQADREAAGRVHRGAGLGSGLFASQDFELANHGDYVANEDWEGQVTDQALAEVDREDRERSALMGVTHDRLDAQRQAALSRKRRRKQETPHSHVQPQLAPQPPAKPPDSPGSNDGDTACQDDDGVVMAFQSVTGELASALMPHRRPKDVKPIISRAEMPEAKPPALLSSAQLPPDPAKEPVQAAARLTPPRLAPPTRDYFSLGEESDSEQPEVPRATAASAAPPITAPTHPVGLSEACLRGAASVSAPTPRHAAPLEPAAAGPRDTVAEEMDSWQ